ncbi:MAG: AraC family transcriptional regulator [Clostridiales bacterium]|nr:AraC family transcriptional regulator [Clostridiales bacterium]
MILSIGKIYDIKTDANSCNQIGLEISGKGNPVVNINYTYYIGEYDAFKEPHIQNERCYPFTVIVFVVEGCYYCRIGEIEYRIGPGETLIVPPYVYHNIKMEETGKLNWAHVSAAIGKKDILLFFRTPTVIYDDDSRTISQHIVSLVKAEQHTESFQQNLQRDQHIAGIYDVILKQSSRLESFGKYDDVIYRIHDEFVNHPEKAYTLADLAQKANLSVGTFSSYFKQIYGKSPMEYVLDHKVKHSIILLMTGNSVKETARALGFYDEYYFSKQFKKRVGCSPSEYVRTHTLEV